MLSFSATSRLHPLARLPALLAVALGVFAVSACETQQDRISSREDLLSAAGFIIKPANTPERQAMLKRLPPNQFVQRVSGNDVHYVYADPVVCGCLYIGTQQDFAQYVSNQQLDFEQAQRIAYLNYYDAAWNWDAWGPWGPLGPVYGPGW